MTLRTASAIAAFSALLASALAPAGALAVGKQIEHLNRGAVAIKSADGVFISWRQLASDAADTTFNVYRDGVKLNATPLNVLNYIDPSGGAASDYVVHAVVNGVELAGFDAGATWPTLYKTVPVQAPAGGTTPDQVAYTYEINDGGQQHGAAPGTRLAKAARQRHPYGHGGGRRAKVDDQEVTRLAVHRVPDPGPDNAHSTGADKHHVPAPLMLQALEQGHKTA